MMGMVLRERGWYFGDSGPTTASHGGFRRNTLRAFGTAAHALGLRVESGRSALRPVICSDTVGTKPTFVRFPVPQ